MGQIEYNTEQGLRIAEKYNISIDPGYTTMAVKYKKELQSRIENGKPGRWARKKRLTGGYKTYCGQFSLFFLQDMGFDIKPFTQGKNPNSVNTTMQYANALKNKVLQVTMEEAFYLACVAVPCQFLSPRTFVVNGHPYNHSAISWPIFTEKYNPEVGPYIAQEGWFSFFGEPISDKRAWGEVWTNKIVKAFVPMKK